MPGGGLLGSKSVGRISDLVISTRDVEPAGAVALRVLARKLLTLSSQEAGSQGPSVSCYAMLCYAMLCCAVRCCAAVCCAT